MAELILTEEEKAAETWLHVSDETLGRVCRKTMLMIKGLCEGDCKKGLWQVSCAQLLIGLVDDADSVESSFKIGGYTKGGEERGDWEITIKRVDKKTD